MIGSDTKQSHYLQLRQRLVAYFCRGGSTLSDAEDMTQEVFVRLAKSEQPPDAQQDSYVFTIARNLQRDRVRWLKVRQKHGQSVEEDIYPLLHEGSEVLSAERVLISREEADLMIDGLGELPDRRRNIFILHRLEGKTHKEIAERFGISTSAVEKNIAKAMLHLSKKLGRTP